MHPQPLAVNRWPQRRGRVMVGLAALAAMVAAAGASTQTEQNTAPVPPPQRPAPPQAQRPAPPQAQRPAPPQAQRPAPPQAQRLAPQAPPPAAASRAQLPGARVPVPVNGANNSPAHARAATTNSGQSQTPLNSPGNSNRPTNGTRRSTSGLQVASLNANQASAAVQSRIFLGHPGPPGSTETRARSGNIVRTAADGSIIDVRSPRNGMSIHHGVDGSRQILVDQPDRSRIFASSHGIQYVQHPYVFRGRPYDHRTFYVQGHTFHQFYRPYNYAGTSLDVYAPARFYEPGMYRWATSRFNAPQPFKWGYMTNPTPWFGYYKGYFVPDTSYTSPTAWLADFVLSASLAVAYATAPPTSPAPPAGAVPAITPQVKQQLADEVGRQVKQESVEAQQNAQNRDPPPGAGGVVQELGDRQSHVFVVASDLDLVDPTGRRCMISAGDVVQVVSGPKPSSSTADAIVLASKGGVECDRAAQVEIALTDLQEMQNHMRETIDQGMASTDAGKKAATVTPAFAASAPPPDPNAGREIDQQQQIAAAAEG